MSEAKSMSENEDIRYQYEDRELEAIDIDDERVDDSGGNLRHKDPPKHANHHTHSKSDENKPRTDKPVNEDNKEDGDREENSKEDPKHFVKAAPYKIQFSRMPYTYWVLGGIFATIGAAVFIVTLAMFLEHHPFILVLMGLFGAITCIYGTSLILCGKVYYIIVDRQMKTLYRVQTNIIGRRKVMKYNLNNLHRIKVLKQGYKRKPHFIRFKVAGEMKHRDDVICTSFSSKNRALKKAQAIREYLEIGGNKEDIQIIDEMEYGTTQHAPVADENRYNPAEP